LYRIVHHLSLHAFPTRRSSDLAAASAAAGSCGALLFGSTLIYPLYFQVLHGDSTIITGLRVLCLGGGTAAVLPIAGRLTDRYGGDRKSTRLNSSHVSISDAVCC